VHHRSHAINPLSGLQFSLAEKAILTTGSMGFIAILSQFLDVSIYSILAFYFIYYTNSLIGHSNIEVQPSGFTHGFLHRVFTSPTYHALHHARFNGHYGLTIPLFDRLNRSIFPDYVDIHRRVTNGQGLARLSDRLSQ
jgi:sterol desaturase/sphingolipid hydroxylase (fatty acid hydroxylase superfamily)